MNDAALCGIQYAKRKGPSVFSHLLAGKTRHCVQLGLARLTKSFGINDEAMLTIKLTTKRLEKHDLKGVKHLAILCQCEMSIATR